MYKGVHGKSILPVSTEEALDLSKYRCLLQYYKESNSLIK